MSIHSEKGEENRIFLSKQKLFSNRNEFQSRRRLLCVYLIFIDFQFQRQLLCGRLRNCPLVIAPWVSLYCLIKRSTRQGGADKTQGTIARSQLAVCHSTAPTLIQLFRQSSGTHAHRSTDAPDPVVGFGGNREECAEPALGPFAATRRRGEWLIK